MPKIPIISGKRLLKILVNKGYKIVRQKGSHVFIEHKNLSYGTVIPIHSNEDLGKGIIKNIIDDLDISINELISWL